MSDDGRIALLRLVSETNGPGHLRPGQVVAEQFTVVRFIARGGMGLIYEARGPGGERVAIKTVSQAVDDPEARARFEREAEALLAPGFVFLLMGKPVLLVFKSIVCLGRLQLLLQSSAFFLGAAKDLAEEAS